MNRYLSAYELETDIVHVFTEDEFHNLDSYPSDWASDWVWQFAPDRETARAQHHAKVEEWEVDPTKETY